MTAAVVDLAAYRAAHPRPDLNPRPMRFGDLTDAQEQSCVDAGERAMAAARAAGACHRDALNAYCHGYAERLQALAAGYDDTTATEVECAAWLTGTQAVIDIETARLGLAR